MTTDGDQTNEGLWLVHMRNPDGRYYYRILWAIDWQDIVDNTQSGGHRCEGHEPLPTLTEDAARWHRWDDALLFARVESRFRRPTRTA